jgi:hypothetical protein
LPSVPKEEIMLKKLMLIAATAAAATKVYGWLKDQHQRSQKKAQKEALQVWEGEGGNPPPPRMPGKTAKPAV